MAVVAALELDDLVALVAAGATRSALIVASVPELTMRTRSMDGTARDCSASRLGSVGAPKLVPARPLLERLSGPFGCGRGLSAPKNHVVDVGVAVDVEDARAFARATKRGAPPTDLNARTGLLTPPGRIVDAAANSFSDEA